MLIANVIEEYEELCSEFQVHEVTFNYVDLGEEFSETSSNVKQALYHMIDTFDDNGVCLYNKELSIYDVTFKVS